MVDDSPTTLLMASALARSAGHQVETAVDGEAALVLARAHPFHVVLIDLDLPDTTGFDLARRIRGDDGPNRFTPLLALSATESPTAKADCVAAGMLSVLKKPLSKTDLERLSKLARAD